jgi:hypothetical protein
MILSCVTFFSCDSVMHEYTAQSGGIEYNIPAPLDSSSDFEIVIDAEMDFPVLHGNISMPYADAEQIESVEMDLLKDKTVLSATDESFEVSWFNNFTELKSMNDLDSLVKRVHADTSLSDKDYPVHLKFVKSYKKTELHDQLSVHLRIKSGSRTKDTTVLFTLSTSEDHRGFRFH